MNNLANKLVNILDTMAGVPKKGYNKHQNYYYMREIDVLEVLKEELVKHKIMLLTSSKLIEVREKSKTDKNGNSTSDFLTTVETAHTFIDSESGEQLTINSVGQGICNQDKGSSKAITASVKYALMKTFMISDAGADIENDQESKQEPVVSTKSFLPPKPIVSTSKPLAQDTTPVITQPETKATPVKTAVTFPKPAVTTKTETKPEPIQFKKRGSNSEPNFP